jgi:hypothetical protein
METKNYYYNSNRPSQISHLVFYKVNCYNWTAGPDTDNYQCALGEYLIRQDQLLSTIHAKLQGKLNIIMMPPMTMYRWHVDKRNAFNLNFYNSVDGKLTAFQPLPDDYTFNAGGHDIAKFKSIFPLIKMDLIPMQWTVFNAQIFHMTLNSSNEPQYILQYSVKKGQTKMTYYDMVSLLENSDPNQYPVYPEDDGTDRPRNPYSPV